MKYLSLFSGIGGFELGIQQAYENISNSSRKQQGRIPQDSPNDEQSLLGAEQPTCIGFSEIDKYATQIYQKHFPEHKNYGDITKIEPSSLPSFDLIVGGFPCQSFSIAGKRGGFEDTRGTLFFEIARIIKEKQPRLLLLENVKGLLSHDKGSTFRTILKTLDELGYDLQWQVLNSKNHGVPQNRERVFIVGHLRGTSRPEVFPITGTDGNSITQLNNPTHSNDRIYGTNGISPTLNTAQGGNRQPFIVAQRGRYTENPTSRVAGLPTKQMIEPNLNGTSNTLSTVQKDNMLLQNAKIRRLTPIECERLQGFPETEKYAILEVCKQASANGAEITLNTRATDRESVVLVDVLIDCVENGVEIYSQRKLLLSAKNAEKKNWSHPLIKIDDFVQLLVGINTIKEKVTRLGEEESHQNEQSLTLQKNGEKLEKLCGNEITQLVGDVKNDSIILNELLKLTTSNHSNTENLEQKLQTLSLFVIRAISGYIPSEILNQDTFTIGVRTRVGYTYGVSDTQRYKCLGNAVTVNVIKDIVERLLT